MGNGALIFAASAFTLWLIGRGYVKNLGAAINTLIGASSSGAGAGASSSGVPSGEPMPPGAGNNLVPQLTPPSSNEPGFPNLFAPSSWEEPYNYTGAQFA